MSDLVTVPMWLLLAPAVALGVALIALLFWHGAVATEQHLYEQDLDARDAHLREWADRLADIEGAQVAKEIRRSWNVALPGMGDAS